MNIPRTGESNFGGHEPLRRRPAMHRVISSAWILCALAACFAIFVQYGPRFCSLTQNQKGRGLIRSTRYVTVGTFGPASLLPTDRRYITLYFSWSRVEFPDAIELDRAVKISSSPPVKLNPLPGPSPALRESPLGGDIGPIYLGRPRSGNAMFKPTRLYAIGGSRVTSFFYYADGRRDWKFYKQGSMKPWAVEWHHEIGLEVTAEWLFLAGALPLAAMSIRWVMRQRRIRRAGFPVIIQP
jgi:hypothetical protein